MDKWSFGITLTVLGIGATFVTLWVLSLVIALLKKIFPLAPEETKTDKKA